MVGIRNYLLVLRLAVCFTFVKKGHQRVPAGPGLIPLPRGYEEGQSILEEEQLVPGLEAHLIQLSDNLTDHLVVAKLHIALQPIQKQHAFAKNQLESPVVLQPFQIERHILLV